MCAGPAPESPAALTRIDRILRLPTDEVRTLEGRPYFALEDHNIGLVPARRILDLGGVAPDPDDEFCVVVICDRSQRYGLVVERFRGRQQRPEPRNRSCPDRIAGAIRSHFGLTDS